ncbi:MAG: FAD-dependent oxidoreductase [Desulfurococcaceae archaeon]|uniref:FAD-dependent oxidoreductase n=1 Tax=Pyrobaculum sp. TaxID=2004705 RepID=UPI0031740AAE
MGYKSFDAIIIGGGSTGLWTTLDLTLRGFSVLLVERNTIGSGTSGKLHGLLHSGARYAVTDPNSAKECIQENIILTKIAPHAIEDTGGYFVSITKEDEEFKDSFLSGLKNTGIPFQEIKPSEAIKEEPELGREVKSVIYVPDKVVYATDLLTSIEYTAFANGALILEHAEVVKIEESRNEGLMVKIHDKISNKDYIFSAKVIVNAAGPWAGHVARSAGINVEVLPTAGTMTVVARRLTRRVINRLRPPSDGDILVPYSNVSIMGTTAFIVEDPDNVTVPEGDPIFLIEEGSKMVPKLKETPIIRSYLSVRPLIKIQTKEGRIERMASRDFQVVVHEKPKNMVTVIGGKFTTGRLMGEKVGDIVTEILGGKKGSKTASTSLANPLDLHNEIMRGEYIDALIKERYNYSIYNGIDDDRGKIILYFLLQTNIYKASRTRLGIS